MNIKKNKKSPQIDSIRDLQIPTSKWLGILVVLTHIINLLKSS